MLYDKHGSNYATNILSGKFFARSLSPDRSIWPHSRMNWSKRNGHTVREKMLFCRIHPTHVKKKSMVFWTSLDLARESPPKQQRFVQEVPYHRAIFIKCHRPLFWDEPWCLNTTCEQSPREKILYLHLPIIAYPIRNESTTTIPTLTFVDSPPPPPINRGALKKCTLCCHESSVASRKSIVRRYTLKSQEEGEMWASESNKHWHHVQHRGVK